MCLKLLDELGGTAGAHHHYSGGEGIESAGVAHFELFEFHAFEQRSTHSFHGVKRCPAVRLVDVKYFSVNEIHVDLPADANDTHNKTIHGKPHQLAFLHKLNHPLAGKAAH